MTLIDELNNNIHRTIYFKLNSTHKLHKEPTHLILATLQLRYSKRKLIQSMKLDLLQLGCHSSYITYSNFLKIQLNIQDIFS